MENENIDTAGGAQNTALPNEPAQPIEGAEPSVASTPPPEPAPIENTAEINSTPSLAPSPASVSESTLDISRPPKSISPATSPAPSSGLAMSMSPIKNLLSLARERIQARKRKKFARILELAGQKGRVANKEVEKLLRVSDATATRYLSALVKANKLRMVGHPRDAHYEPIN